MQPTRSRLKPLLHKLKLSAPLRECFLAYPQSFAHRCAIAPLAFRRYSGAVQVSPRLRAEGMKREAGAWC